MSARYSQRKRVARLNRINPTIIATAIRHGRYIAQTRHFIEVQASPRGIISPCHGELAGGGGPRVKRQSRVSSRFKYHLTGQTIASADPLPISARVFFESGSRVSRSIGLPFLCYARHDGSRYCCLPAIFSRNARHSGLSISRRSMLLPPNRRISFTMCTRRTHTFGHERECGLAFAQTWRAGPRNNATRLPK